MKKITLMLLLFSSWCFAQGDTCADAIDLGSLESPIEGTTVGAADDSSPTCGANTSPDLFYSLLVPNGSTLTINQTLNNYDSRNYVFYGDCDNQTQINCFDDGDYTVTVWENTTGSDQTVYWVQDGYQTNSGTFTLAWSVIACTNPIVQYSIVSDCDNGEQFFVNVNVDSLGSATSVTVSDDQGSEPQNLTDVGELQFGPFPNATPVVFTVANDQDADCTLTSTPQTQNVCPPSNDTCESAIDLTELESPIDGSTIGANNNSNPACGGNTAPDTYYSIFVPSGSTLSINQTVNNYDSRNYIFYGDCDNQTQINCFDDGDYTVTVWENTTGSDQTVYWVQDGYLSQSGNFTLAWSVIACTNPVAEYTIVSDCDNGEQFFINVNVSSLGSATSVTVSDDQGSEPQNLTDVAEIQFGPYANATPVVFTISNDDDGDCSITSTSLTQSTCPPNCANAIVIENCGDEVTAEIVAGTGSWSPQACGFATAGNELLYSFTPTITGVYSLTITAATGGYIDYFYKEASGTCDQTGWTCIDDNNFPGTDIIGELIEGTQYLFLLDGEGVTAKTATFIIACAPTCTNATANYSIVADCSEGNEQFFVDVNVSDMGTAVSLTVSDDQGGEPQGLTDIGMVQFGPFPLGTPVVITVANDDDDTCILTSPVQNLASCPPTNDTCANAIDLTELQSPYDGTTIGALNDSNPVCGANTAPDTYFSILVPSGSTLSINQTFNNYDSRNFVFYGDCDNQTQINCFDDDDYQLTVWENNTGQDQTVYWVQDGYNIGSGNFTLAWSVIACTSAAASYSIVADCSNGNEQFFVDVNVTEMGSASSLTISDDQGIDTQSLSDVGTVQFGPYPFGAPVIFTITNDQDTDCTVTSPAQNLLGCPPANDNCENATPMIITGDFEASAVTFDTTGATVNSLNPLPSCGAFNINTTGKDVWYQSTAPESGNVIVETRGNGGLTDTVITIYSGSCDNLVEAGCDDDAGLGNYSLRSFTGLTPGQPLFIRVWGYNGSQGSALLGCYDSALLNTDTVDQEGFKFYPNPVKDVLNLSYSQNITEVAVFNLIGQQVLTRKVNSSQSQVDMSSLSAGAYLVKVTSNNLVKTIKVIKE